MIKLENLKKNESYQTGKIGEYIAYFFIFSNFISSKLNMKVGYILLSIAFIYIFLKPNLIKRIPEKIYGSFSVVFILGIIWNYFASSGSGIPSFIHQNGNFIYGVALCILLTQKEIKKINIALISGVNVCSILYLFTSFRLFKNDLGIIRGIIFLGFVYTMVFIFEKLFETLKNIPYCLLLIFPIIALIKSNSRMAVLTVLATVFLYGLHKVIKNRNNFRVFLGIVLALLLLFIMTPTRYKEHIKSSFNTQTNKSNIDRIIMLKAGMHIFKNNPIFGVGNEVEDIYPLVQEYVDKNIEDPVFRNQFLPKKNFAHLHNMYMDIFVENGLLGILYLVFFLILIPYKFFKSEKTNEETASFFSIISFYIYGLTWSLWNGFGIINMLFQIFLFLLTIKKESKNNINKIY